MKHKTTLLAVLWFIILGLMLMVAVAPDVRGINFNESMYAYFPMDTDFNSSWGTGKTLNATALESNIQKGAKGKINTGIGSNGSTFQLSYPSFTDELDNFTACWWANATFSDGTFDYWLNFYNGSAQGGWLIFTLTNDLYIRPDVGVKDCHYDDLISADNVFTHLCVTYNHDTTVIGAYINNVTATAGAGSDCTEDLTKFYGDTPRLLRKFDTVQTTGYMDELMIFNRILSQAEVGILYNYGNGCQLTTDKNCDGVTDDTPPATPVFSPKYPAYTFALRTNLTTANTTQNPMNVLAIGNTTYNHSIADYIMHFTFDINSSENTKDTYSNYNGNVSGATWIDTGKYGGAYSFDNDYINVSSSFTNLNYTNDATICAWYETDNMSSNHFKTIISELPVNTRWTIGISGNTSNGGGYMIVRGNDTGSDLTYDLPNINNHWYHFCAVYDDTTGYLYFNGTLVNTKTIKKFISTNNDIFIGKYSTTAGELYGSVDDVRIYNRSLTAIEVSSIFNSTYPQFTCELKNDGVVADTNTNLNITVGTTLTLDTTGFEENHTLNITCTDNLKTSSAQATTFIDTVNPTITISLNNQTTLFKNIDTLNIHLVCSDTNLFSCNATVFRLNPNRSINRTLFVNSTTGITTTTRTINWTDVHLDNLTNSPYKVRVETWDDHTANNVRNLSWYFSGNNLVAEDDIVWEGDFINETGQGNPATYFYIDPNVVDRYKLKMTWDDQSLFHSINISSPSGNLDYRLGSDYKGHFVHFPSKRWIDHEGTNIKAVNVTSLGNNKWNLLIEHYTATDEAEFESIGDMNFAFTEIFFNVSNSFTFYANDSVSLLALQGFTISVDGQTKTASAYNISFNITSGQYKTNASVSGYVTNTTNITYSAGGSFVWRMYKENSLYLFFFDEETDELIDDRNVTVWAINLAANSSKNVTGTGSIFIEGFSTGEWELRYTAPDYRYNTYYVTISQSTTQSLSLYLVQNASSSLIIFSLTDDKGSPLFNYTLKSLRYQLADNAYVLNAMSRTDANGETSLYLVPNDIYYQFIVDNPAKKTVFTGSPQKVYSTTVYIRVPLMANPYFSTYQVLRSNTNLSYNTKTQLLTFYFSNIDGHVVEGCLQMDKISAVKKTSVETCTAASTATITINMTPYLANNTMYNAYAYLKTNSTFTNILAGTLLDFFKQGGDWQKWGKSGLFMGYIFVGTMFMIGLPFSFAVAVIYSAVAMLVLEIVGLTALGWALIVSITIIGLGIAYINKT